MSFKALLCDTNRGSLYIYKYLLSLGFKVTVVGNDSDQPLARICDAFIHTDYSDIKSLSEIIHNNSFDAIIPGCTDSSYLSCITAASRPLKGFDSLSNTKLLNTKSLLRELCLQLSIPQPKVFSADEAVGAPAVLIKPVDSFSGQGITELNRPSAIELEDASTIALSLSPTSRILYEEKIDGQLYSYSVFLLDSLPANEYIVREDCTTYPYAVDTSCIETTITDNLHSQMHNTVAKLASHLGLSDGLIHCQFIVKDHHAYLIEVTRRHPGDLYGQLISYSTGDSYSAIYANQFLPADIVSLQRLHKPRTNNFVIRHTVCLNEPFNLENLSFSVPVKLIAFYPLEPLGSYVSAAPRGRVAIIFLHSDTLEEHEKLYGLIISKKLYTINRT